MRIAFITSHIYKSTQWNWFSEELLNKKIAHIHIIISGKEPLMAQELSDRGIKVFVLYHHGKISFLTNLIKIIKILKKEKVNIVHTELPYGNLLGQLGAYCCGIKKRVTTCENVSWALDHKNKKQFWIDKLTYHLAKKIIVLTDLSKNFLIKKYKLPEEKIVTIWHALKLDDYANIPPQRIKEIKNEFNIKENEFILGMVARGEEWKGHIYAIKAVQLLKDKYPDLRLLIVGIDETSAYGKQLRIYINNNKLNHCIQLINFVADNIALYRIFHIHIHLPVDEMAETFGITYMEGMISGCPQIITRSGIAYFSAQHLKNCYVVNYKNEKEVAQGIEFLMHDDITRTRIAENAKRTAQNMFLYSNKVNKHLELYNRVVVK